MPSPLIVVAPVAPQIYWHVERDETRVGCFHRREDAAMFAAAPDLLAACKGALLYFETFTDAKDGWPVTEAMRAAIAKAEGNVPT